MRDYYDGVILLKDPLKRTVIGIEWRFDDGTKSTYYPDNLNEEWFLFFVESVKEEQASSRKERHHCPVPLVGGGRWYDTYFKKEDDPVYFVNLQEEQEGVDLFISQLTFVERRRVMIKLDNRKMSFSKIAAIEGTSKIAIFKSFRQIREKAQNAKILHKLKFFNIK